MRLTNRSKNLRSGLFLFLFFNASNFLPESRFSTFTFRTCLLLGSHVMLGWISKRVSRALELKSLRFWFLGFFNNFSWVAMNAGAGSIVPGEYALIYIVNQVPAVLIKATAPYWFHAVTYDTRILISAVCMAFSFPLVTFGVTKWLQLLGVALVSVQSGLGESTGLGLSQHHAEPKACLVMWSSGTGFAGPGGYLLSLFVLSKLGPFSRVAVLTTPLTHSNKPSFLFNVLPGPFTHGLTDRRGHGPLLRCCIYYPAVSFLIFFLAH